MSGRNSSLFDLSGRVALVTGGSRGLGLQIAEGLGEHGAELVLAARKASELDEAVAHLASLGIKARGVVADLGGGRAAANALCAEAVAGSRRLDILVNNAGATWGAPAEDYPEDGWNKVMNVNVTGLFELTAAVARTAFLPQGQGSVINVASIEGIIAHHPSRVGTVAYNASKGAVIAMTRALAAEWGPRGIRVNALAPGFFPSKMTKVLIDDHIDEMIAQTPLCRIGGDQDLKGPAVLLASDAGRYMTGQILIVDGGYTII